MGRARARERRPRASSAGGIDAAELNKCLSLLGHHLSDEQSAAMFRFIDHDGDGSITFDEFCSIWKRRAGAVFVSFRGDVGG